MKPLKLEPEDTSLVDSSGFVHIDNGDRWHIEMPRLFHTARARRLFKAAEEAGILEYIGEAGVYDRAKGISKAQLAYWCKKASTYLGLDKGSARLEAEIDAPRTNWEPFEDALNPCGAPLRSTLHNIAFVATNPSGSRERMIKPIDDFFRELEEEDGAAAAEQTDRQAIECITQ